MIRVPVILAIALTVAPVGVSADELTFEEALSLHRVVSYLEARDRKDRDAQSEFYAKESRIWFGEKKGEGRLRSSGKGPWSDWDDFFNSETAYLSFGVDGRTVAVVMLESNDFYKLIDRPASKIRVTYEFDPDGFVTGTVVQAIRDEPIVDRLDEFRAWAAAKHPERLAYLMPDDEISPELEKAKVWKQLLLEWRGDVGLPAVPGVSLGDR